jgi:hypothetical protein
VTATASAADPDVITKGEFARRRNVSPGRVSQWISDKKIFGAAIVGEGRAAQIRETVAIEQLKQKLDPMQMAGNGVTTNLTPPAAPLAVPAPKQSADVLSFTAPAAAASPPTVAPPAVDTIEDQIKRARLEQIARQNRDGQRQEAVEAGRLTDATIARSAAARETMRLVTQFEGALSDFATAISAEFKLPQRDVLHLLRGKFRDMRRDLAAAARETAETMPAVVDIDLAAPAAGAEDIAADEDMDAF